MDIHTFIDQNALDHLFQLFTLISALLFFWFLEAVYRLDKRWLVPIFIFPLSILGFIFIYWEHNRGKCFFATLAFIVMLLIGGLVGHSFVSRIFAILQLVAFWPYYLLGHFYPELQF